jgi:hypothetical protein
MQGIWGFTDPGHPSPPTVAARHPSSWADSTSRPMSGVSHRRLCCPTCTWQLVDIDTAFRPFRWGKRNTSIHFSAALTNRHGPSSQKALKNLNLQIQSQTISCVSHLYDEALLSSNKWTKQHRMVWKCLKPDSYCSGPRLSRQLGSAFSSSNRRTSCTEE